MSQFASWAARLAGNLLSPGGRRAKLTILTFHNVVRRGAHAAPGDLDQSQFVDIIDVVKRLGRVLPLQQAVDAMRGGDLPPRAVALTFDDGYADWVESVCPVLKANGLPATFFLSADHLSGRSHWHERIADAVQAWPDDAGSLPLGLAHGLDPADLNDRDKLALRLQQSLKYLSSKDRSAVISRLESLVREHIAPAPLLGQDSIRAIAEMGFEIGAHTSTHPILTRCDPEESWREIAQCRHTLEAVVQREVTAFAYPNGRPNVDYAIEHVAQVREAGYRCAVTTAPGVADQHSDVLQLPRYSPWPSRPARLALQLASNLWRGAGQRALPIEQAEAAKRCLLVASTFPPQRVGTANVYGSLCASSSPGTLSAMAASKDFVTGQEVQGWQAHDARCGYPIQRLPFIRPPLASAPRNAAHVAWRLLSTDLPIFLRALSSALMLIRRDAIRTVCIGDAVSGGWLGVALKTISRVRLVVYVHGDDTGVAHAGRLNQMGRAAMLKAADHVIAASRFARDDLIARLKVPIERITVVEGGVDPQVFAPGSPVEQFVQAYRLQGKRAVLAFGRLVGQADCDTALDAMRAVVEGAPNVHFLVAGQGPASGELLAGIERLGLQASVSILGELSETELAAGLRSCEFFWLLDTAVHATDMEGGARVLRAANATGKAALGHRSAGTLDAIVEGYNGLLLDGQGAEETARKMLQLLQDDVLRERLANNGLDLAKRTNVRQAAENFNRICLWLVARSASQVGRQ
ncbi:MAG: polysaccharide deacetylase family protein [Rubrivivax sp.]